MYKLTNQQQEKQLQQKTYYLIINNFRYISAFVPIHIFFSKNI